MKVNMTPNPLDVVTIHASQGDTEARQWEFELHNNGELIDTSDVKEQLVFKAYKGGTEQLLPENGSTPTTSPFNGDIKYPQGLLAYQEFTYRQSPTEEDGLAKITDIKGNTIVWNQIAQLNQGVMNTCTKSYDDTTTITTITPTSYESNNVGLWNLVATSNLKNGHKYYVSIEVKPDFDVSVTFGFGQNIITSSLTSGKFQTVRAILTWTASSLTIYARLLASGWASGTFQIKNVQCIDLTQMGLDSITTIQEFTSLFSLPYYSYNQGSLLSFNGNGIKTVGKNLINANESYTFNPTITPIPVYLEANKAYTVSFECNVAGLSIDIQFRTADNSRSIVHQPLNTVTGQRMSATLTPTESVYGLRFYVNGQITVSNIQIEYGSTATSYEPYTSSTLSLPISTYFPTGMKSAGNVYDELTESKAITRAKQIIFDGSNDENWNVVLSSHRAYVTVSDIDTSVPDTSVGNIMSNIYASGAYSRGAFDDIITTRYGIAQINIFDSVNITSSSTTATWKAYLQEHPLIVNYGIATPTETSFSTASLVTENAEIPLSNEDGVLVGKCTEQLSENPGFFDAKIKLTDADGECYSNKLQLHVERSPQ